MGCMVEGAAAEMTHNQQTAESIIGRFCDNPIHTHQKRQIADALDARDEIIRMLKRGSCWCDLSNRGSSGEHSGACAAAQEALRDGPVHA